MYSMRYKEILVSVVVIVIVHLINSSLLIHQLDEWKNRDVEQRLLRLEKHIFGKGNCEVFLMHLVQHACTCAHMYVHVTLFRYT